MKTGNLLIITGSYPNEDNSYIGGIFIKDQIKELKHFFNHIYVISPTAIGINLLRKTEISDYSYDNISVHFPKYINCPIFWYFGRKFWVHLEGRAVNSLLIKLDIKFDIIHAHFTWPSGATSVKIKQKYNKPLIITEHSSITFNKAIKNADSIFINAWGNANHIIRIRAGDVGLFERVGIEPNKISSIPNGYDDNFFHKMDMYECRTKLILPDDKKIIINVGNFYSDVKGHKHLIDAISFLTKNRQDVLCIIVGSGSLGKNLEEQVRSLGLTDYIKFVGAKNHDEIPFWINACDLFVLPSLNEGNPTVMFEALGCGKPFIGTRVGGVPEVITSDDYGLLVEPANPEDLAEKILIALDRKWDEKKILDHAAQYTWENVAIQIMNVYEQVLKETPQ